MAIEVSCPSCGHRMLLKYVRPGETAVCRQCGAAVVVPVDAKRVAVSESEYLRSRRIMTPDRPGIRGFTPGTSETGGAESSLWRRAHPMIGVLFDPVATIQAIISADPGKLFYLLSGIYGAAAYTRLLFRGYGVFTHAPYAWLIVLTNLAVGAVFGMAMLEATSYVYAFVGRILGGLGNRAQARAALAWSSVPLLVPVIVGMTILLVADGPRMALETQGSVADAVSGGTYVTFGAVRFVFGLWHVILCVVTLATVMRFSALRAIMTFLLGGAFLILCMIAQAALWDHLMGG